MKNLKHNGMCEVLEEIMFNKKGDSEQIGQNKNGDSEQKGKNGL